jgi:hypothetical protein
VTRRAACRGVLYQCQYVRIWVNAVEGEGEGEDEGDDDDSGEEDDERSILISKSGGTAGKKQALQVTAAPPATVAAKLASSCCCIRYLTLSLLWTSSWKYSTLHNVFNGCSQGVVFPDLQPYNHQ